MRRVVLIAIVVGALVSAAFCARFGPVSPPVICYHYGITPLGPIVALTTVRGRFSQDGGLPAPASRSDVSKMEEKDEAGIAA
jgi:hypothetical protein